LTRRRRPLGLLLTLMVIVAACDGTAPHGPAASPPAAAPSAVAGGPGPVTPAPSAGDPGGPAAQPSGPPDPLPSADPSAAPSGGAGTPDPAKFGFARKGLRGEVFAFVTTTQVDEAVESLDLAATSTVVFFSLQAGANGSIQPGSTLRAWSGASVDRLIERAHAAGTKVVFAISRFSWSASQTANSTKLLDSAAARARLATEVADEVVRRGVDGVNVDFEPIPKGRADQFTDLVRRVRSELDARRPGLQLTFDVVGHFESYDVAAALRPGAADAVYLMGYHYAGTFSTVAHATAPLAGPRYSVSDAIRGLRKVGRPNQILVGGPYYGHLWPTKTGSLHARTTGGGGDVPYENARVLGHAHGTTYDPVEAVEWSAWRVRDCASCASHWVQLYFDDARSLGAKWAAFRRQGLLGTGFWTFGFQGESGELAAGLREAWLAPG